MRLFGAAPAPGSSPDPKRIPPGAMAAVSCKLPRKDGASVVDFRTESSRWNTNTKYCRPGNDLDADAGSPQRCKDKEPS